MGKNIVLYTGRVLQRNPIRRIYSFVLMKTISPLPHLFPRKETASRFSDCVSGHLTLYNRVHSELIEYLYKAQKVRRADLSVLTQLSEMIEERSAHIL